MPDVRVVPAEIGHVYALADRLRERDRTEVESGGHTPRQSLFRGFRNSVLCRTAFVDDDIAAMWGLCLNYHRGVSLLSDLGVPWLLTSAAATRVPVSYLKIAKAELAAMRALRPKLEGYVAAEYVQAVRFLRLIGFTVDETVTLSPHGGRFMRFHIGF